MSLYRRFFPKKARPLNDSDAVLRRALLAVLERDFARAETLLERAVKLDSENVENYLALAQLYRTRGEVGRCIRIHQNLLLRPDLDEEHRVESLLGLANDFRQGGFIQRAIEHYRKVLVVDSANRVAMRCLIPLMISTRDVSSALSLERKLLRLEGKEGAASGAALLVRIAEVAREEGKISDARRAVKRALQRDPECVDAWIVQGDIDAERGRGKRAIEAWLRVPALDLRKGARVFERLKVSWMEQNRGKEFEVYLRSLLQEYPGDESATLALVDYLVACGETEGAISELRDFLELGSDHLEARRLLGRLLMESGRREEALEEDEKLLRLLDERGLLRRRESSA